MDALAIGLEMNTRATNFTRWMYHEIKPFVRRGNILEVGSGLGIFSRMLARDFGDRLYLTDVEPYYVARLRKMFRGRTLAVRKLDLTVTKDYRSIRDRKFDTIVCMNVLEHIENDSLALRRMRSLLAEHGVLVLLVPAFSFLFNTLDKALGHKRRYTKITLVAKLRSSGFSISRLFYFDSFGIPGWYLFGNIMKRQSAPSTSITFKYFDLFVPVFAAMESWFPIRPSGISLIAICSASKA